jgi:hypothetical protein
MSTGTVLRVPIILNTARSIFQAANNVLSFHGFEPFRKSANPAFRMFFEAHPLEI